MADRGIAVVAQARALWGNERGQIGLLFAIGVTAMMMMTGASIDYIRSSRAKTTLQNATDAVVLAVARDVETVSSNDTLKQMARDRMATMLPNYSFDVTSVSTAGGTITINAEGSLPAGLAAVAGFSTLKQRVTSSAVWGTGKLEVALVLDSTGSMASYNRMVELKKAAAALLAELETSEAGLVKVGIVPFDVNVRVPTSYNRELVQDGLVGEPVLGRMYRRPRPEQ